MIPGRRPGTGNNMKNCIFPVLLFVVFLIFLSCSISRKYLYYSSKVSNERLEYIQRNFANVKETNIILKNGIKLHGWLIEKDLISYPTILCFGGNGEEVSYNIEQFNQKLDANILLMNYRGYGLSSDSPTEKRIKEDAVVIFNYFISNYDIRRENIIAFGRSLGTGIAAHLAVMEGLQKVILVSPYDSIEDISKSYIPKFLVKFLVADKYRTIDIADQISGSVLVIA